MCTRARSFAPSRAHTQSLTHSLTPATSSPSISDAAVGATNLALVVRKAGRARGPKKEIGRRGRREGHRQVEANYGCCDEERDIPTWEGGVSLGKKACRDKWRARCEARAQEQVKHMERRGQRV
jgi:hypothetical protein